MEVEKYVHEQYVHEQEQGGGGQEAEVDIEYDEELAALELTTILSPKNGSRHESHSVITLKLGGLWEDSSIVYQFDHIKPASFSSSLVLAMDSLHPGSHSLSVMILSKTDGAPLTRLATSYFTIGELMTILPSSSPSTNSWYSLYPRHLWVRNIVYSDINVIKLEAEASRVAAGWVGVGAPMEASDTRLLKLQVRQAFGWWGVHFFTGACTLVVARLIFLFVIAINSQHLSSSAHCFARRRTPAHPPTCSIELPSTA